MPKLPALFWLPFVLGLPVACAPEPQERPGTWRATGANEANLRAMVADPAHLERGAAPAVPARGEAAAMAAGRLARTGEEGIPALPQVTVQNVRR